MKALIAAFLDAMRYDRGFAESTCDAYGRALAELLAFATARKRSAWRELSPEDLRAYLAMLRHRGYAVMTLRRHTATLRTFFTWLLEEGHIPASPAETLRVGKAPLRLPQTLPEALLAKLLDAVDGEDLPTLRDRALLEVLYGCGLRCGEAAHLQLHHLDLRQQLVRVHGKGRKERVVPFGPAARAALLRYLHARRAFAESYRRGAKCAALLAPTAPLFLSPTGCPLRNETIARIVHERIHAALPPGLNATPHTLRHAFATHLLEHGAPLIDIRDLLGHASIATTQIYTHVDNAHLRETFNRCFPRK